MELHYHLLPQAAEPIPGKFIQYYFGALYSDRQRYRIAGAQYPRRFRKRATPTVRINLGCSGVELSGPLPKKMRPPTDGVDGPLTASKCQDGGRQRSPATGAIHGRYYDDWS